jgi:hypothetical protein
MKRFTEYLAESKKTYAFKVKVAGDLKDDFQSHLKAVLEKFSVANMSAGKRTPIQETPLDFPDSKFAHVTTFDVELHYPTTSHVLENYIGQSCGVHPSTVRVRVANEPSELYQASMQAKDEKNKDALLNQCDYPAEDNQSLVGEKAKMSLLKELEKTKHTGDQVTGINDQLLAAKLPTEKQETMPEGSSVSPIGSIKGKK